MSAGAVLSDAAIRRLVASERPLVTGYRDLDGQIQPNGIDLTLESVWRLTSAGRVSGDGSRLLPERERIVPAEDGYYELLPGPFVARLNETVHLPTDLMALGKPRSTLLRCGVAVHNAVWDAGYAGRSEVLIVVYNPAGFRVERHARFLQLVFFRLAEAATPYQGVFQGENLDPERSR